MTFLTVKTVWIQKKRKQGGGKEEAKSQKFPLSFLRTILKMVFKSFNQF